MRIFKCRLSTVLALAALPMATLAIANNANAGPFVDGSFESPGNGSSKTIITTGIGPWVHGGAGADYYTFSSIDGQIAQDGSYFVGFGQNGSVGGTLSQTFDTSAGTTYGVNFYVAKQQDGAPSDAALFNISAVNSLTSALLNSSSGSVLGTAYVLQTFSFIAESISSTLTFRDDGGGNNGSYNLSADNFSVTDATDSSSVPEPFSLTLVGIGLVGLGLLARSRKGTMPTAAV